jgi:hypothetical protein
MVISVVVKTVDVVKENAGDVIIGVDVMTVGLVGEVVTVLELDAGVDTPGLLVIGVMTLEDGVVTTLLGAEVGVLEGLVTTGGVDRTVLVVVTKDDVLVETADEVEVPTLLVGVLVGNVETGVDAD